MATCGRRAAWMPSLALPVPALVMALVETVLSEQGVEAILPEPWLGWLPSVLRTTSLLARSELALSESLQVGVLMAVVASGATARNDSSAFAGDCEVATSALSVVLCSGTSDVAHLSTPLRGVVSCFA